MKIEFKVYAEVNADYDFNILEKDFYRLNEIGNTDINVLRVDLINEEE